ncbi:glycoside hydrolase family 2 protein [Lysobacter sp. CFH 32150]|uniref:beta-mannosidase n=1 Tax=Lysobacter sp. CFH 32150 TaxID=2927128 RepID=UPI001FA7EF96|nr:glycoside hydrolase family 2 protein [Lysobacter sp. CFH 32150]MCI4569097.1 glycoside hydrolase family 2 protein [Lysobacter sp. CFH 32150]
MIQRMYLLLLCLATSAAFAAQPSSRKLDSAWSFRLVPTDALATEHDTATQWRSATVPGYVHTDLLAHGAIPDTYVGAPEAGLQWIGLGTWEYRTQFDVDRATLKRAHADLVFEGLDTFADVYLNETKLLSADNAHRTWRVPVQGKLRARGNQLRVVLHSPIRRLLPQVQAMPHKLAGNYPSPFGDEPKDAMTVNFARKPAYHSGWDWGPRYVTAGIWRPVRLESWDALRIGDFHVQQNKVDEHAAELAAEVEIESDDAGAVTLEVEHRDPDGKSAVVKQQATLVRGQNKIAVPLRIDRPRRWYPTGYGEQALYTFTARVVDDNGKQAEASRRTGLRSVELRRERDQWGRGFAFVINGIPVFAKGANTIPFDAFPARVTQAQLLRVLESARDANMNMVRSWGGGHYESDAFFELTDELGLLVWQDFMFGGGMQPAYDPAFRANVVAEARDNIRRLRDHPSLVLWCGNNEEETAWKNWGQGKALTAADPAFAKQVWDGYVQLFGHDLRDVVVREGGGVPYWSSSPSNDLDGPANDSNNGDKHDWGVWAESKPIEAYLAETPRFVSEFGLQGWPSLRTIDSFATKAEQGIESPVIRAHQKFMAGDGNARVLQYIREGYGEPKDFADFVYLSQVMQAEGIELASLHHRASRPRTMGSLYWQLNDVWPGASWASIDYYGRWKPLHFHARRFFAPLAVAALRKDAKTEVTLVSDRTASVSGELRLRVIDFDGKVLRDERKPVTLAPLTATAVANYADAELLRGADRVRTAAVFELLVDDTPVSRRIVYFDAAKALALPDPGLHAELQRDVDGYRLDLHADKLARAVWIDFGELDVGLSDNALSLLPGETVSLRLVSKANLDDLQQQLTLRSLTSRQNQ